MLLQNVAEGKLAAPVVGPGLAWMKTHADSDVVPRPAAYAPRVFLSWADVSPLRTRTGTGLVRTPRLGQRGLYRHRAVGCPHLEDSLSRVPVHRSVTRRHLSRFS